MLLQELDLPHDYRIVEMPEAKSEEYIKLNPNGRLPTLQDPNTGITLWEVSFKHFYPCQAEDGADEQKDRRHNSICG